jgi:integrase
VGHLKDTSKDGFLIPGAKAGGYDAKRSHYLSRTFGFAKKRLGFTDSALVFHTLRNSFMQRCEKAGVPERTVKQIVGHSRQDSLTYGLYSPGPGFDKLSEGVRKVSYGKADAVAKHVTKELACLQ